MTNVTLVRHGETDWNVEGRLQGIKNTDLNEFGISQAHACGAFLKERQWDVIISSPLKRAKETAIVINKYIGHEAIYEIEGLKEMDFGEGCGMTSKELASTFPDGVISGMEDRASFANRTMEALTNIVNNHSDQKVLVIAHGAVINSILSVISDGKYGYEKTRIDNGGITELHYNGEKWNINSCNEVGHLVHRK